MIVAEPVIAINSSAEVIVASVERTKCKFSKPAGMAIVTMPTLPVFCTFHVAAKRLLICPPGAKNAKEEFNCSPKPLLPATKN